jgi:hypothetical protein
VKAAEIAAKYSAASAGPCTRANSSAAIVAIVWTAAPSGKPAATIFFSSFLQASCRALRTADVSSTRPGRAGMGDEKAVDPILATSPIKLVYKAGEAENDEALSYVRSW